MHVEKGNSTSLTSTASSSSSRTSATKTRSLQLIDTGIYLNTSDLWDDIAYIYYVGLVYNPNSEKVAFSPKLIATAKNKDGTILATDEQSCGVIMPGDTVPIMGSFSVLSSELSDDSYVSYQIECNDFRNDSFIYSSAKTSDFETSHISEYSGSRNYITGEVTSHFSEDCTMLKIVALLKKNGKIVGAESTYMSTLNSNQTKVFEIESLSDFQNHDSLEIIVVPTL